MRIAVVGSGISGLVAAYELSRDHEVTVFESDDRPGGHTHTVEVQDEAGDAHRVDTGFMVCNERTYPAFFQILRDFQIPLRPTDMSFSIRCPRTGIEWNGSSINRIFAQRRNLLSPSFLGMIKDILRFQSLATRLAVEDGDDPTVSEFIIRNDFGRRFVDHYLLPLGASLWSNGPAGVLGFSMRFIARFLHNHGMLAWRDRPRWMTVAGGSDRYIGPLSRPFAARLRLATPVRAVERTPRGVRISIDGEQVEFDEAVLACHSNQALGILRDADPLECDILGAIHYRSNEVLLHTDEGLLPRNPRARASWNYLIPDGRPEHATVTYNLNLLQGIESRTTFCVSLNSADRIDPSRILRRLAYDHPVFTRDAERAKTRHRELIRNRRTSFCGAYWGQGFHEDGVQSALRVAAAFRRGAP